MQKLARPQKRGVASSALTAGGVWWDRVPDMKLRRVLVHMSLIGAGMLPFAVIAATYKWVDERGVVNYGDAPPRAARQVRQLDEEASRVSTIPAVPRAQLERENDRLLRARVARLEEELESQRRAQSALPVPVPVYEPYYAYSPLVAGYAPVFGVPRFRPHARFGHRPVHPPVRSGVSIRVGSRR
jgi:Domain of unknown function (DUF4124)